MKNNKPMKVTFGLDEDGRRVIVKTNQNVTIYRCPECHAVYIRELMTKPDVCDTCQESEFD